MAPTSARVAVPAFPTSLFFHLSTSSLIALGSPSTTKELSSSNYSQSTTCSIPPRLYINIGSYLEIVPRSQHDALLQSCKFLLPAEVILMELFSFEQMQWPFSCVHCSRAWSLPLHPQRGLMLTPILPLGLPPLGGRDGHLHGPNCPPAVHMAPQALYLYLREPDNSETTIWHEGMGNNCIAAGDISNL